MNPPELHPCLPPKWAPEAHTQTILGRYLPFRRQTLEQTSFRLEVSHGDQVQCYYVPPLSESQRSQVVYLFHGLGGSVESSYISRTTQMLHKEGHHVFLMNHRGCGDGEGLARRPYHSGSAADLLELVRHGHSRFPDSKHLAIGFSLSGNALLLLLGRDQPEELDFAISVNAPLDLNKASLHLQRGFNRIYDLKFTRDIQKAVNSRDQAGLLSETYPLSFWGTLREVDELYTAPAAGFLNREDYYGNCSSLPHLPFIQVPTLLLTTRNDPFVPVEDYESAMLSESTFLQLEPSGGHLGYLSHRATPLGTRFWLDYALREWTRSFFSRKRKLHSGQKS